MTRIIVAGFSQETNSFNPEPTTCEHFRVSTGQALLNAGSSYITGALGVLSQRPDLEIVPTYGARAGSGGTLTQECFERIAGECLEAIRRASPGADGMYFAMHGAMVAAVEKDPEGYLLEEIRSILGPDVPIVISLDMHGTLTRRMLENISGVAVLHTYPHVDAPQTGERAARQLLRILGGARPVIASVYTPTMVRGDELKTATGALGTFIRHCQRLEEQDEVLAAGIMLGHPPTDVPEQGSRVFVVTDDAPDLAAREALSLGTDFWAMRRRMQCVLHSPSDALAIAEETQGPVVFSDAADATSSGASGTSNAILRAIIERGYSGSVLLPIRDAPAVQRAIEAGLGSAITVPLGGTGDSRYAPCQVDVSVEMLSTGKYYSRGGERDAGALALLKAGAVTLVVSSRPGPLADYALYAHLGLDPRRFDLIVVKLPHTPHYQYDAWAERNLTIDVPGPASANIRSLGHKLVPRPIYPLDDGFAFTPHVEVYR